MIRTENSLPLFIRKCSTMGPSESAGKNVSAPTIRMTPTSQATNSAPCVGKVPTEMFETMQQQLVARLEKNPLLAKRVKLLNSIRSVGPVTALTWILEVGNPHRFTSIAKAVSYCGLTSALDSSADKQ